MASVQNLHGSFLYIFVIFQNHQQKSYLVFVFLRASQQITEPRNSKHVIHILAWIIFDEKKYLPKKSSLIHSRPKMKVCRINQLLALWNKFKTCIDLMKGLFGKWIPLSITKFLWFTKSYQHYTHCCKYCLKCGRNKMYLSHTAL